MTPSRRRTTLAAASAALLLAAGTVVWLEAQHDPYEAIDVARAFTAHLRAKQFQSAYELTTKSGYVGASLPEFEAIARRQACDSQRVVSTFPFQSNGNRLRRWARGETVDVPEVTVEFEGPCLLGVTLRRTQGDSWRVSRFATHAG